MLRNNRKKISGFSKLLRGSSSQTLKKTLLACSFLHDTNFFFLMIYINEKVYMRLYLLCTMIHRIILGIICHKVFMGRPKYKKSSNEMV